MFSPSASACAHSGNQASCSNAMNCALAALSFTTTATAAPVSRSLGAARAKLSILRRYSGSCVTRRHISESGARRLRQRDALEGTDHVVGTLLRKETFVIAGAKIPIRSLVVVVTIKSPDPGYDNETADPIIPVVAHEVETQVRACEGPLETNMIVKHELRKAYHLCHERYRLFPSRRSVITQRTELPFHVDDAAVIRRQFSFGYLSHKKVFSFHLNRSKPPCRAKRFGRFPGLS